MARRTEPATMAMTTYIQAYRIGVADPCVYTRRAEAASGQPKRRPEQCHLQVFHRDTPLILCRHKALPAEYM
jgi:hypothetical protein